jgi:hypothetical protein
VVNQRRAIFCCLNSNTEIFHGVVLLRVVNNTLIKQVTDGWIEI